MTQWCALYFFYYIPRWHDITWRITSNLTFCFLSCYIAFSMAMPYTGSKLFIAYFLPILSQVSVIGSEIEVRVASSIARLSHQTPRHHQWLGSLTTPEASPWGVMRLPSHVWRRSDRKSEYQFLFYHGATIHTEFMQIGLCKVGNHS